MRLQMRNGNVAIEELDGEKKTPGGIIIADPSQKGSLRKGKIIAAGKGELIQGVFVENDLTVGTEVVFDFGHAAPISVDGKEYLLCNMIDVVAVLDKKPNLKAVD